MTETELLHQNQAAKLAEEVLLARLDFLHKTISGGPDSLSEWEERVRDWRQEINEAWPDIRALIEEAMRLRQWKAEQLSVEAQWNPQEVGGMLGIGLGQSIRASLGPRIVELIASLTAERARCADFADQILALLSHDTEDLDLPDGGCSDHLLDDNQRMVFDERCPYCMAEQLVEKIKNGALETSNRERDDWQSRCEAAEAALKASQDESWANWNSFKRVQTELAAIKSHARALLLKWDEIEADASFNGIFVLAAAHGMGYSGPNMTDETAVLRSAAEASEATKGEDFAALPREKVALEIEVERLRADKGRLEFLISVLNCWNLYGRFLDEYHPTRKTTRERAEDAEWRQAIDGAREA